MEPFLKIVRPGLVPVWSQSGSRRASLFVTIKFNEKGELSITAVEGPLSNGDALGSCGQADGLDVKEFAPGWDSAMVERLGAIWHEWHLNRMRPYDTAMKADGWRELAARPMLGYRFSLTSSAWEARRAAEKSALDALREGEPFEPSPAEFRAASREMSYWHWIAEGEPEPAPRVCPYDGAVYERERDITGHNKGGVKPPERKTLGWLQKHEHPEGLLSKVHPVSGNGYGRAWYGEDVPADVLQWLRDLPDADKAHPWGAKG